MEVLTFNNENDARSFVQLALGAGYTSKLLETVVGVAESVGAKRLQMRWDDLKIHERVAPRPVPAGGAPPAGPPMILPARQGARAPLSESSPADPRRYSGRSAWD